MVHESEPKRKPSLPLDSTVFNDFHLGECIGKGASGTVFKGLNMKNGEVVAIKQIRLTDLSKIALDAMMLEINLLKKLNHTNIVHYSGYFKTKDYLNIILEYCENGSLQSICKKIGKIPENLAGVYIAQVLEGLLYLHEQGVVHRDIKGANILTTKDACVKLSDFGVATLATHDRTVVGSPYWMAPEVIELTGATTASDIWSLGCTVIELLEGNPPYHYLSPMPALFRIVQDDHPPLPEGCSAMVKDFLLQCFQKDANLRVTAKKLLKHPWIQNSQRKPTTMAQGKLGPNFDQDLRTVREWNEALKGSLSSQQSPVHFNSTQKNSSYPQFNDLTPPSPPSVPIRNTLEISSNQPTAPLKSRGLSITALQPEEDEDNWDDDFDITTPTFSLTQIKKEPQARKRANSRAVREVEEYGEDYLMDSVSWKERIKDMELRLNINSGSHRLLYPSDLHWFTQQQHQLTNTFNNSSNNDISIKSKLKAKTRNIDTTSPLARYMEEEEEGYEDLFFDSEKPNSPSTMHSEDNDTDLMHKAHLEFRPGRRGNSTDGYPTDDHSSPSEDDEDDPFHSLEEGLEQTDLQANILRDKHARVSAELKELIQLLKPEQDDMVLIRAATKLETILLEHQHLRSKLLTYHGVLPILEMLESSDLEPVLTKLLRTINLIVHSSIEVQENLCLVGGIPIIMGLASKRYPWPVRLEAAYFIKQMCHTSLLTLQMFISCRGLKVLVDFMEEDYRQNKELIFIAINGISSVFELQTPTPKHDFCRLFAKSGLLEPLAMALTATLSDSERAARKYTHRIIQLFFIFSQADAQVKERMGNSIVVIQHLLSELKRLPTENIIIVLKCIKNLSSHPNTLETLERANIIETLTHYLAPRGISGSTEICSQVLNTLYNLCRINKRRQDRAAQAGAIPHLQQVVAINSPLKQVALPILCDMAHAGPLCRKILWKNHGLHFYLGLLRDPTWQVNGLESVLVWLQEEPKEVEKVLIESQHIEWLTRAFGHPRHNLGVEGLCVPLAKMVRLSPALSASLSMHPRFVHRLLHRLVTHSKALVRVNLLKILRSLFDVTPAPTHSILKNSNVKHNIKKVLENLVSSDPAVLVQEMAKELQQYLCNPGSSSSPNTISLN